MPKTALIIGGTKGLGLSLAWEAYNREIFLIIAGRSVYSKKVVIASPPVADRLELDLTDPESVQRVAHLQPRPLDYVFWVAGNFSRQHFSEMATERIDKMIDTHLRGPLRSLQLLHIGLACILKKPYHLVTIASTSSWRIRENESLYCALKAAKAAFTRNFAKELVRDLPGSKVTLVNPGGIKTGLFEGTGQDISNFMEPDVVARIIWDEVEKQQSPFKEVQIMRNDDGSPNVSYGPRMPELPFSDNDIVRSDELKDKGILNK